MTAKSTKGTGYADRLSRLSGVWWKRVFDVQRPYRWNLRRLKLGKTLDVGCGIGRNLINLGPTSVGVDHNPHSVAIAKKKGLSAYTSDEFRRAMAGKKSPFDSMLLAHVLEHMPTADGKKIIQEYLPYVKTNVVVICPQEKGFASDETHVNFLDHRAIADILVSCGLKVYRSYSFPFHRITGKVFTYNETVVVAKK
jgi:SAM-dependent methyltransferase